MSSTAVYNKNILEQIWNGKIPVQITVDTRSIQEVLNTNTTNEEFVWNPIYLEVPRCSYLPLVTEHIQKVISQLERTHIIDQTQLDDKFRNAWYEYLGVPLKWHYPIGLLHDLYCNTPTDIWTLTLQFDNLPTDEILEKPTVDNMRDMYMSMMKEADFLLHGSTKKVMNLSKKDSKQLWQGVVLDAFEDFHNVNKNLRSSSGLLSPSSSPASKNISNNRIRYVPLKIYLPNNCPVIQELISFSGHQDESASPTIQDILKQAIPELTFPLDSKLTIMLHGIEVPLDTPIVWAYENLAYADNFLHMVIKYK
ncbi:autophagy protein Apg5-domain-containing protein [Mycotypha africana]|uniref:autophagy protein Apg5-domain-containing protein n=1 Tax=Mycotypha africana TaxID=64632 RepID=UPI0023010C94|nr:autophagy protein Apg5-domain-containing protein [Mycotypha africana]KAI8982145.1 autophagy protein Apg5-domain-containing protein [Mycotypha africana]